MLTVGKLAWGPTNLTHEYVIRHMQTPISQLLATFDFDLGFIALDYNYATYKKLPKSQPFP